MTFPGNLPIINSWYYQLTVGRIIMKFLKQFSLIMLVSFLGEILHEVLPLPIPASVYGLILMLLALMTGIIRLEHVRETAVFLIEIMPVMFVPAGVKLMTSWGDLKPIFVPVIVITAVSTVVVMAVTGRTTQWMIRREKSKSVGQKGEQQS